MLCLSDWRFTAKMPICVALLVQTRSIDLALDWGSMYGNIQSVSDIAPNAITPVDSKSQDATLRDSTFFRERLAKICSIYPKCRAVYLMHENAKKGRIFCETLLHLTVLCTYLQIAFIPR